MSCQYQTWKKNDMDKYLPFFLCKHGLSLWISCVILLCNLSFHRNYRLFTNEKTHGWLFISMAETQYAFDVILQLIKTSSILQYIIIIKHVLTDRKRFYIASYNYQYRTCTSWVLVGPCLFSVIPVLYLLYFVILSFLHFCFT